MKQLVIFLMIAGTFLLLWSPQDSPKCKQMPQGVITTYDAWNGQDFYNSGKYGLAFGLDCKGHFRSCHFLIGHEPKLWDLWECKP